MRVALTTVTMIAALTCVGMASDGVIEINQARALAGGVTPGDAPGFPVTIAKRGSYRLTGDLDVPPGVTGVEIQSSDVTIDLNGFAIVGGAGPVVGQAAIVGLAVDDIAVLNGVVRSFPGSALIFEIGWGIRIERVTVHDVGIAIQVDNGIVSGCTIDKAGTGILVGNQGLVTGNNVTNTTYSAFLFRSQSVAYSNNVLSFNKSNLSGGVSLGANLCDSKLCQ